MGRQREHSQERGSIKSDRVVGPLVDLVQLPVPDDDDSDLDTDDEDDVTS